MSDSGSRPIPVQALRTRSKITLVSSKDQRHPGVGRARQAFGAHAEVVVGAEERPEAQFLGGLGDSKQVVAGRTLLRFCEDTKFHPPKVPHAAPAIVTPVRVGEDGAVIRAVPCREKDRWIRPLFGSPTAPGTTGYLRTGVSSGTISSRFSARDSSVTSRSSSTVSRCPCPPSTDSTPRRTRSTC